MHPGAMITGLLCIACVAACSPAATPTDGVSDPQPTGSSAPQPSRERTGAGLTGTVLDENGTPIPDCLIRVEGVTNDLAVITNDSGVFTTGLKYGQQHLTINCDKHQIYQEEKFTVDVPRVKEFEQTFTIHKK